MKLQELVNEAVGADVLYHSVSFSRFFKQINTLIKTGVWESHTRQKVDGKEDVVGSSLSRSIHLSLTRISNQEHFGRITFVLDRKLLNAANKIVGVDYYNQGDDSDRGTYARLHDQFPVSVQAEEYVVGDVKNFGRAISEIIINTSEEIDDFFGDNDYELGDEFDKRAPDQHPDMSNEQFDIEYLKLAQNELSHLQRAFPKIRIKMNNKQYDAANRRHFK